MNLRLLLTISSFSAYLLLFIGCNQSSKDIKEKLVIDERLKQNQGITQPFWSPSFTIRLKLSKKAKRKLDELKESVVVEAQYTGVPDEGYSGPINNEGLIILASERKNVAPSVEHITFDKIQIPKESLTALKDKDFDVLINVFSGRKTSRNNILSADILEGKISLIKEKEHKIKVDLL